MSRLFPNARWIAMLCSLICDNGFKISSAFERTKLEDFDVSHRYPHPYSRSFERKVEQKTTVQDLSILLWQCLKDVLYSICCAVVCYGRLFYSRALPASIH